jgi:hypothetical protein
VAVDDVRREIVLAVRGSSSLLNWLVNLDYKLQWVPLTLFGQVHAGFLRGWNEISADVYVALAKATLEHPEYRIVATGHSLGGAVSTIGAAYLRSRGYAVDMYNYGSPRVGNFAFASFVTNQPGAEYRVTDRNDPVPQLPPIAWGYSHISPEYWLSGELSTGPTYPLDEIKVCQGPLNLACNGGTDDLTLEALQTHAFYFGVITCNPNIVPPTQDAAEVEGVLEGLAQPPTPEDVQAQQDALGQAVPPTAGDAAPGVDTSTQQEGGSGSKDDVSQDDDVSAQDAISDELELAAAQDRFPARDTVTVTDAVTEERTVAQTWACWARKQFQ